MKFKILFLFFFTSLNPASPAHKASGQSAPVVNCAAVNDKTDSAISSIRVINVLAWHLNTFDFCAIYLVILLK